MGIQPFKQNGKLIDFVVANARKSPIGFNLHQDFAGVQRSEAHKHVQCKPSERTSGSKEAAVIPAVLAARRYQRPRTCPSSASEFFTLISLQELEGVLKPSVPPIL